jgi:hypothetical protein
MTRRPALNRVIRQVRVDGLHHVRLVRTHNRKCGYDRIITRPQRNRISQQDAPTSRHPHIGLELHT